MSKSRNEPAPGAAPKPAAKPAPAAKAAPAAKVAPAAKASAAKAAPAAPAARPSGRPSVDKPPALSAKYQVYFERLMVLRDQMVDEIRTLSDQSLSANKQAGEELADIGSENFLREMELGLVNEENKKIILVQEAFERLRNGTYGVCLDCNKTIGEGRLEAIPYAKLCVNCKARREQEEAGAAEMMDAEETGSDEEEAELTE